MWNHNGLNENLLDRINSRLDTVEEIISELEDRVIETIQNETWRPKKKKIAEYK